LPISLPRITHHPSTRCTTSSPTNHGQAFYVIYDGAIYLNQGRAYYCTSLDLHQRVALVRPARATKHYTSVSCCV